MFVSADRRRFVVHAAEQGNAFMLEIAQWLVAALGDAGHGAALRTAGVPQAGGGVVNLVVAPHEYFELALTDPVQRAAGAAASIPVCTEQPGTPWFEIQLPHLARSPLVLDISPLGVRELRRRGLDAHHLALGYHDSFDRWHGDERRERPIDVVFLGSLTPRREAVLASLAPALQSLRCRFVCFEANRPARAGDPGFLTGAAKHELLASAKVLLNVHRNDVPYFESVRALEAVANGAVLVTEPSLDLAPLRAVDHVVTAPLDTLAATVHALVTDPDWLGEVRRDAYAHLRDGHRLADNLAAVLPAVCAAADGPLRRRPVRLVPAGAGAAGATPPPLPPVPPGNEAMVKKLVLENLRLRRRLDELECLVRFGTTRHDEVTVTPAWDEVVPDVSVVIPCYNYGRHVTEAIDSVASNHSVVPEIIVVDDHSGDGSSEIVRRYAATHEWVPLKLVTRHANGGLAAARNLGFGLARSPYVMPLDADNALYPHALARLLDAVLSSGAAAAYGMLEVFHERQGLLSALEWSVERLVAGPYIDAAALIRKEAWAAVGGYCGDVDELYGWEDYDLWLNLADHGLRAAFVPEMLVRYRSHSTSMIHTTNIETASVVAALRRRHRHLPWPAEVGA
jgi:GT2 family glycosyltransferase